MIQFSDGNGLATYSNNLFFDDGEAKTLGVTGQIKTDRIIFDNNKVRIGIESGYLDQSGNAIAIGYQAGYSDQSGNTIAIGTESGKINQGEYGIAIGHKAGTINQHSKSIILNASDISLNSGGSNCCYISPVNILPSAPNFTGTQFYRIGWNSLTKELFAYPD